MLTDTIAAIATPGGEGGIAIIRVSGPEAIACADAIFSSRKPLREAASHTITYGHIRNPQTGERTEEVLVTVMRAPRSYTTEDVVEINCHGGFISVRKVLELILDQGVRLAEPGEFTKRAFLNGRIDLAQAEAVIDLIRSKSDRAFQVALRQVEGALSKRVKALRHKLVEVMAHIEVNIDYPEHDVEEMTNAFIREHLLAAKDELGHLLASAAQGKILREGITTAIVGRPNVGKSSLLNELAQESRAIVTDIPGTTRDVIEEYVTVAGIPLKLLDTAGIRETADVVERIGVERSRSALSQADLILLVLNAGGTLHEEERELLRQLGNRQTLVILNKIDLPARLDPEELTEFVPEERIVRMSLLEQRGRKDLEKAISGLFLAGKLESADLTYVSNARHIQLMKSASKALDEALGATEAYTPIDMIQIDIRRAWEDLGDIVGDSAPDSLLDQIFSQFCLGK